MTTRWYVKAEKGGEIFIWTGRVFIWGSSKTKRSCSFNSELDARAALCDARKWAWGNWKCAKCTLVRVGPKKKPMTIYEEILLRGADERTRFIIEELKRNGYEQAAKFVWQMCYGSPD